MTIKALYSLKLGGNKGEMKGEKGLNISQIEFKTGLSRANVRFYEKEGLLEPKRLENGYRDYSEADLETLMRIKLLRQLYISLDEIKQIQNGSVDLKEVLNKRLEKIKIEISDLQDSEVICKAIYEDGVSYQELHAQKYLDLLDSLSKHELSSGGIEKDVIPQMRNPWIRFWARFMDEMIYGAIVMAVCYFVLNMYTDSEVRMSLINLVGVIVVMFLAEPLLLTKFGATIGKSIFGISVKLYEGSNLTYSQALQRTINVFRYGLGYSVPIFQWVCQYNGFVKCQNGEELIWDEGIAYTVKDKKKWRWCVFLLAAALLFGGKFLITRQAQLPRYRGDISTSQFVENFNRYQISSEEESLYELTEDGEWRDISSYEESDEDNYFFPTPEYTIIEKDGVVTEVGFEDTVMYINFSDDYIRQMRTAVFSYIGAQPEINCLNYKLENVLTEISNHSFENFSFTEAGIQVTCYVHYQGYEKFGGSLYPEEGKTTYLHIKFKMKKVS